MKSILFLILLFHLSCNQETDNKKIVTEENNQAEESKNSPSKKDTLSSPYEKTKTDPPKQSEPLHATIPISHPEAIGLWIVPKEKAKFEGKGWMAIPIPNIFNYNGRYLTLQIMILDNGTLANPPKWPSKDGFYKLKTEWRGDSLFYHSPFKKSEFLARFADSVFLRTDVYENLRHTWQYERITEEEVPEYLRPVLKKRKVFDYSLVE